MKHSKHDDFYRQGGMDGVMGMILACYAGYPWFQAPLWWLYRLSFCCSHTYGFDHSRLAKDLCLS